jgi:hypothetical protein
MRREQNYEENVISLLAWLKYNAKVTEFAENDISFISYNIDHLERQGIVLSFFKKYMSVIKLSNRIADRCYVEYKTNPKKQVFLHYRILKNNDGGEYITERMSNVLMGIHVKGFVLFYNEELQYYITEELEDEVNMTESFRLSYDSQKDKVEDSKYNRLNKMLKALDKQDDSTLLDIMADFVELEYITSECALPLT